MKLPLALVFVASTVTAGAVAAIATSCAGDDGPSCRLHCTKDFPTVTDAGVPIDADPDLVCPDCADPATLACPTGCAAIG